MLELKGKCIIGIDLAGSSKNPAGWAMLKDKTLKTLLLYTDKEITEAATSNCPTLTAIDAPFNLSKKTELFRKADREMIRKGYRVFPPNRPAMKKLALRATRLNKLIE